ncbi:MAG: alpha/beta hydrolase family protein [Ferruginibacter sp.]
MALSVTKAFFVFIVFFILQSFQTFASTKGVYVNVSPNIRYLLIGTYDINRLSNVINKEVPEEIDEKFVCDNPKNTVNLYRVEYQSVIPEQNNRPTIATGLIAIPVVHTQIMPMVSYQHGTVFGKYQVPSYPDQSFETRLMIAQFAGQGYVVIGADYFGMGDSKENDSYIVIGSQTQASYDMYEAAKLILEKEGIAISSLFVTGWSQGGVITMSFLEKLESAGVKVSAAGTAAAQCDGYIMTNGFLQHPRKIDAPWVTTMFILTAFSFEEYYQKPGLAKGLFNPSQFELAKRVYLKDTTLHYSEFPLDLHSLIRPEYFNSLYYKQSEYGKLISQMHPYKWDIKTPLRMYYGDQDECLTIGLAKLPSYYQKAMGNINVESISTGIDSNHRKTFARAAAEWKKWFDSFKK